MKRVWKRAQQGLHPLAEGVYEAQAQHAMADIPEALTEADIANIFARQVEGLASPGDILILHSTSGESANLLEAARVARRRAVKTVGLLARGGGALKNEVDLAIVVPTDETARAQEMHLAIGHAVAEWVDRSWADQTE